MGLNIPKEMATAVKLLWENGNVHAAFPAQTVPLDLSRWPFLLVRFRLDTRADTTPNTNEWWAFTAVGVNCRPMGYRGNAQGLEPTTRDFSSGVDGVNFSACYTGNNTTSTTNGIPMQIYGVRF